MLSLNLRIAVPNAEIIFTLLENKKGPEGPFLKRKTAYSEAAFLSVLS
jgi:hypothetical protein